MPGADENDAAPPPSDAPVPDAAGAGSPSPRPPPAERALYDEVAELRIKVEALENPLSSLIPNPSDPPEPEDDIKLPLNW